MFYILDVISSNVAPLKVKIDQSIIRIKLKIKATKRDKTLYTYFDKNEKFSLLFLW